MSRGRRSGRGAAFFLLVLCIGLGSLVYWQLEYPPAYPSAVVAIVSTDQPAEPGSTDARQAEFTLPPLEQFSEIVARPLFSQTRLPPSETEDTVADDAQPLPIRPDFNLILAGVVISAEGRMALLQRPTSTDLIRALLGQEIDGWQVELIEADRVTLRHGETVEVVTLKDKVAEPAEQQNLRGRQTLPLGLKDAQSEQLDTTQATQ